MLFGASLLVIEFALLILAVGRIKMNTFSLHVCVLCHFASASVGNKCATNRHLMTKDD